MDCFAALAMTVSVAALLAMTWRPATPPHSRGGISPGVCVKRSPPEKTRAWGMPGVDAPAASCVMKANTRVSHHRSTGLTRHSRTQWFYGLLRALPGDHAF